MRRLIIIIAVSMTAILGTMTSVYLWIGESVQNNIEIAQSKYPGNAEDALMSFLQDENNSPDDRTHIAIWTLGQIDSKKALPILKSLYKDDPEGKSCFDHHDTQLCQYEIHKAIRSIEKWRPLTYARLKSN